jgi:anthranilate phosphoribosyltransferase
VLENRATQAQKNVVLINAAFAIHVIEQEMTFQECLSLARESLESGAALNVLKRYIAFMS